MGIKRNLENSVRSRKKKFFTAWGTSYVTSSPNRLSFLKNGAYYDVDKGVDPDYVISSYERYYDREALVEYINSLY